MFLIKYTEALDHDIETTINLYQTHKRLITENLINVVLPSFRKIEFFDKHRPKEISLEDFLWKAIPYFRYEEYSFGQILQNIGEEKQKLFIILDGSAIQYIPIGKQNLLVSSSKKPFIQKSKRAARQMEIWELVMRIQYQNALYWKDGQMLFKQNETYKVGQHFGDLSNDEKANESIIASSELKCISIKKSDYKLLFGRDLAQTRKYLDFFKNLFNDISENKLLQFINFTKLIKFEPKQILWQKGDEPKFMIFLIEGLVETYHYQYINCTNSLQRRTKILIRSQSTGCLVGAEEIFQNFQTRQYSCQCINKTQAFLISKEQEIYIQMNLIISKNIELTTQRKKDIQKRNNNTRNSRGLSLQNTPIANENNFTNYFYCTPRKLAQDEVKQQFKSELNLKQIFKQHQQISNQQNHLTITNTIYPIENLEHYEIMLRLQSNRTQNQNIRIQNAGQFHHCLEKIKKNINTKKFNSNKKFLFSPQIYVSKIQNQDINSKSETHLIQDNFQLRKKLQQIGFENFTNNKSTTTQIFSPRQSQIDFETNQIEDTKSCAQIQNDFQIMRPLLNLQSRNDRLLSQQTDRQ